MEVKLIYYIFTGGKNNFLYLPPPPKPWWSPIREIMTPAGVYIKNMFCDWMQIPCNTKPPYRLGIIISYNNKQNSCHLSRAYIIVHQFLK